MSSILIQESRVFQIPFKQGAFTVVLLDAEVKAIPMDPFLFIPINGPIMLCKLPSSAWHLLWPEKPEPLPWLKLHALHDGIKLQPNLSRENSGGIFAYFSQDTRVPINGNTTVTWFNDRGADVPRETTVLWDDILHNTTPRLPFPLIKQQFVQRIIKHGPAMLSRDELLVSSTADAQLLPSLIKRNPNEQAAYIGSGVGAAVIMALIIWFTVQRKISK